MAPSYRKLQIFAVAISVLSVIYNGAEGGVSIGFGVDSSSRSLIFYGIQSGIEVLSALLVVWRFKKIAPPGEERCSALTPAELRLEKFGTIGIGLLLIALSVATEGSSIAALVLHHNPDTSNASIVISASALVIMVLIWLPKRYLAKALDSSVMEGEATCSLSCIQLTIVLFVGSLVFRVWKGGWWLDSATAMVLGLMFGWEGFKMSRWAMSKDFGGGCCPAPHRAEVAKGAELGELYRDLCDCCREKDECKSSGSCQCSTDTGVVGVQVKDCCTPKKDSGEKCCTHELTTNSSHATAVKPGAVKLPKADCCGTKVLAAPIPDNCCTPPKTATVMDSCCAAKETPEALCIGSTCTRDNATTSNNIPRGLSLGGGIPGDVAESCDCCVKAETPKVGESTNPIAEVSRTSMSSHCCDDC